MLKSSTICLQIERSFAEVYPFLADPRQLPNWFPLTKADLTRIEPERWRIVAPQGFRIVTFTPPNPFGILDCSVDSLGYPTRQFVVRAFANGAGTELHVTLLQAQGTSDQSFASEVEWFRSDLSALKSYLEPRA